jgi:hypothetical protein
MIGILVRRREQTDTAARLAFADHMNRFVAGDRTPSSPKRTKMLACAHLALMAHISTEELERVLQICRIPTAGCSRDACIILMMARLGMRAGVSNGDRGSCRARLRVHSPLTP